MYRPDLFGLRKNRNNPSSNDKESFEDYLLHSDLSCIEHNNKEVNDKAQQDIQYQEEELITDKENKEENPYIM